jgi:putative sugar O-methyltransferase
MKFLIKKLLRSNSFFESYRFLNRLVNGNPVIQSLNRELLNRNGWLWSMCNIPNRPILIPRQQYLLSDTARLELCSDLIESYHLAIKVDPDRDNVSNLWDSILKKNANSIFKILDEKDARKLNVFLGNLFLQNDFWGIGGGELNYTQGSKLTRFCMLSQLAGILEYFGISQRECAEQGAQGRVLQSDLDFSILELEKKLGFKLDFPRISNAYGMEIGGRFFDLQTLEHIYVTVKAIEALKTSGIKDCENILEIGAGFGGACHWINQQIDFSRYFIVDLPIANLYQGWFLSNIYGRDKVKLYKDFLSYKHVDNVNKCKDIYIIPANSESEIDSRIKFNLAFNENSFPEMPEAAVVRYLNFIAHRLDGILFSYNHEAIQAINGEPQVCVSRLVRQTQCLNRISRTLSWVRDGYIEEIYKSSTKH